MCFSADFGHWVYFGLSSNPMTTFCGSLISYSLYLENYVT